MPGLQQKEGPPVEYRKVAELKTGKNLLPPLTKDERSALKESIEAEGRVTSEATAESIHPASLVSLFVGHLRFTSGVHRGPPRPATQPGRRQ
jgi:hypothetical protein